jgi:hypothetical protein
MYKMFRKQNASSLSARLLIATTIAIFAVSIPANIQPANADPGTMEWTEINTPSMEDGVIAPNSDIICMSSPKVGQIASFE